MSGRNTRTGAVAAFVGGIATFFGATLVANDISVLLALFGVLMGIVIIVLGMVGHTFEGARRFVGVALIVLAFLAAPASLGGVLIGFVFTLVAGYVFLTVEKVPALAGALLCPSCRRDFDGGYRLCPWCGAPNPIFLPGR
jgi:hypothetical protein